MLLLKQLLLKPSRKPKTIPTENDHDCSAHAIQCTANARLRLTTYLSSNVFLLTACVYVSDWTASMAGFSESSLTQKLTELVSRPPATACTQLISLSVVRTPPPRASRESRSGSFTTASITRLLYRSGTSSWEPPGRARSWPCSTCVTTWCRTARRNIRRLPSSSEQ